MNHTIHILSRNIIIGYYSSNVPIPAEFLLILHVDVYAICIFNHNSSAVRPPSKRVDTIPDDAIVRAILFHERMVSKISEKEKSFSSEFIRELHLPCCLGL